MQRVAKAMTKGTTTMTPWTRKTALLLGLPVGLALGAVPAWADSVAAPSAPAAPNYGPSDNAMVNLVRLLVAQGTISKDKGDALIAQALDEAEQARAAQRKVELAVSAVAPHGGGNGGAGAGEALATAAPAGTLTAGGTEIAAATPGQPPVAPGTIRVPYIPQVVRDQIRDELRADVMHQAQVEGWASAGQAAPDWTRKFKLYGDIRVRSQSQFYSRFNSTTIPNYQTIVSNGALDLLNGNIPLLNTTEDKYNLMRLRARLGVNIEISPRITAGIELATGNDASPVSTNATLGGGFFKRNIYLYKAFVTARPTDWSSVTFGRMDNPFLSTDALFDPDLKFDGISDEFTLKDRFGGLADFKLRGGVFPLDFGNTNFPDIQTTKTTTPQKWLFSAQLEGDYHLGDDKLLKVAAAYHVFANVQGRLSSACPLGYGVTQCSTDARTPFFEQKGNTLFMMRNLVNASGAAVGGTQLVGLTQPFHVLDVMSVLKVPVSPKIDYTLTLDYLRNVAFRRADACRYGYTGSLYGPPINNGGPLPKDKNGNVLGTGNICDPVAADRPNYKGGNQGFQIIGALGYPSPANWGEWRVWGGYKYLQSDVTLDAFTDDDFHLGGTNAKGYIIGGTLGVAKGVTVGARWLSANQITGDPLAIDVLQFDVNAAF